MWMVKVLLAGGFLMLVFALAAAADSPSDAELQEWQSERGVAESTKDPRFRVPALAPGPVQPVKVREGQEIDEEQLEEIKRRPLPPSNNGAKVIQALSTRNGAGRIAAAPPLGTNFDGFNLLQSGYIPPDPVMAAGPDHLILAVNLRWGIYAKDGTPGFFTTMQSWFSSVNTLLLNYSDPKVMYDQYAGRWMVMCIGFGNATTNRRGAYFVSVSDDADPNGTWYKWMLPVPNDGSFPDFPGVGYDASEAFYFTANHFSNSSGVFLYDGIVILKKSELYADNPAVPPLTVSTFTRMRDGDGGLTFTIKPSLHFGNPVSGTFLVNTQGSSGSNIELWRIINPVTAPVLTRRTSIPIGAYFAPPDAKQPGDSTLIETNSSTIQSEVQYRDGYLYFAFPQAHNFDTVTVSAIRYLQIDTTGAVLQNILYGASGEYFFFPAPLSATSGNAAMVFSHSSPSSFCGTRYVGNFPDDGTAADLKAGEDPYVRVGGGRNRWGDYGGISQDPVFPRRIWMYHEYADAGNIWNTRCGEIVLSNHAPEVSGPASLVVNEQDTLVDTLTILEPDGESLFVAITPLPPYASLTDLGGGKKELKLTPGCYDVAVDSIIITAADNADPALADTLELVITVLEHNCRPLASRSGPDTVVLNQCQTFSLLLSAFDPDSSGNISFSTAPIPAFAGVSDSGGGTGSLNLAPTTADLGGYTVQVFASDGQDSSGLAVPVQVFQKGDLNRDGSLAPADVVLLLYCIFSNAPPPAGPDACDMDGNGTSLSDVVVLINSAYTGDPLPPCQ